MDQSRDKARHCFSKAKLANGCSVYVFYWRERSAIKGEQPRTLRFFLCFTYALPGERVSAIVRAEPEDAGEWVPALRERT